MILLGIAPLVLILLYSISKKKENIDLKYQESENKFLYNLY